jgi:hypothetical protein
VLGDRRAPGAVIHRWCGLVGSHRKGHLDWAATPPSTQPASTNDRSLPEARAGSDARSGCYCYASNPSSMPNTRCRREKFSLSYFIADADDSIINRIGKLARPRRSRSAIFGDAGVVDQDVDRAELLFDPGGRAQAAHRTGILQSGRCRLASQIRSPDRSTKSEVSFSAASAPDASPAASVASTSRDIQEESPTRAPDRCSASIAARSAATFSADGSRAARAQACTTAVNRRNFSRLFSVQKAMSSALFRSGRLA